MAFPAHVGLSLARSDRARWVTALMHREREQPDSTPRGGRGQRGHVHGLPLSLGCTDPMFLTGSVLPCRPEPSGDNPCLHGQAGR